MRMKKGMKVRIINSIPTEMQDEFSIKPFIGKELKIIDHWQNKNSTLDEYEIQVNLPEAGGIIILNKGEWELV